MRAAKSGISFQYPVGAIEQQECERFYRHEDLSVVRRKHQGGSEGMSICQSRQGGFPVWKHEIAPLISLLVLMGLAVAACGWLGGKFDFKGRSFAGHQADLIVLRTSLERSQQKPDAWLAGYVTNRGDYSWRVHELEVRFLDAKGSLLDARHPNVPEPFVVEPHHENAFRVGLGELSFAGSNFVSQVRVQVATDGSRGVKSD